MKYFIGIDPGSKGAVAITDGYGNAYIHDLDKELVTYWYLATTLVNPDNEYYVMVEDVCGRPGQSCAANTTFMKLAGYAELLGFFLGNLNKVKPQIWKKHFGLTGTKDMTKTEKKHMSIDLAKKLFPSVADELTASKDGRAEALLLAKYCQETYNV